MRGVVMTALLVMVGAAVSPGCSSNTSIKDAAVGGASVEGALPEDNGEGGSENGTKPTDEKDTDTRKDGNNESKSSGGTEDDGKETGKSLERPAFDALQEAVFHGSIKTVVVWKLDRISRHQVDGIRVLADWCDQGVRVVSVTQLIDLRGAVGRMVASVLFGIAEIELEYRRERQAAGIRVAKKRGAYRGRKAGTTKATPARALELRERGLTAAEIANALNVSPRTVFRYLGAG
jgi:DNA invertase Pin-like site-specific DNA recombinase